MSDTNDSELTSFYEHVQVVGRLRTSDHARRWTNGVLETMGSSLDRGTKKELRKNLPEELSKSVNAVFHLLHFRNSNQSSEEFLLRAGRRSGNSDPEFALYPTLGVFSGMRLFIDQDTENRISKSLSPEVSKMWNDARAINANFELSG